MNVFIKQKSYDTGKVYSIDGKFITTINIKYNDTRDANPKTFENTAVLRNEKGKIFGEICTNEDDLEDTKDWAGYKWTIHKTVSPSK